MTIPAFQITSAHFLESAATSVENSWAVPVATSAPKPSSREINAGFFKASLIA